MSDSEDDIYVLSQKYKDINIPVEQPRSRKKNAQKSKPWSGSYAPPGSHILFNDIPDEMYDEYFNGDEDIISKFVNMDLKSDDGKFKLFLNTFKHFLELILNSLFFI